MLCSRAWLAFNFEPISRKAQFPLVPLAVDRRTTRGLLIRVRNDGSRVAVKPIRAQGKARLRPAVTRTCDDVVMRQRGAALSRASRALLERIAGLSAESSSVETSAIARPGSRADWHLMLTLLDRGLLTSCGPRTVKLTRSGWAAVGKGRPKANPPDPGEG